MLKRGCSFTIGEGNEIQDLDIDVGEMTSNP